MSNTTLSWTLTLYSVTSDINKAELHEAHVTIEVPGKNSYSCQFTAELCIH